MSKRKPLGRWTIAHTIVALFVLCVTGPGGVFGMIVGRARTVGIATLVIAAVVLAAALVGSGVGTLEVIFAAAIFGVPGLIGVAIRGVLDSRPQRDDAVAPRPPESS